MNSEYLEGVLVDKVNLHFNNAVGCFVVKASTDSPYLMVTVEMILFNYHVVRVMVERGKVYCSVIQSGYQMKFCEMDLSDENINKLPFVLDREVRLRIPDKYLKKKGW